MKKNSIIIIIAIFFLTGIFLPSAYSEDKKETVYEFEKKDKEEERLKFLEKLNEDKKKVELAIGNTKELIDKSRNMPYLPELYLRLAELYIEKSRFVFFIRKNETKAKSEALDSLETNTLKQQAIETYQRILNDFPDYPERDKIRFFMAHEYRELNQIPEMVKQYRAIIKKYPKSPYTPECYLLLGDHFIGKQDLELALRHYKKVLNFPESSAIVIARYKLAWGHVNNREFKKAIKLFEKSVKTNEPGQEIDVDTYKRVDIKMESLVDMAYCYPEVYKKNTPTQAIAYFRDYSWSRQVYMHVLEKLGYRYLVKKKYRHSVEIYRELASLQHDVEKQLEYARNIFECVSELKDFKNADKDMSIIVTALKRQKYSIHVKDEDKEKNYKDFELYARNIVTHLHKKAKKKKSVEGYTKAADGYKLYLDFFEESPVYSDMLMNYAESLFASKQYLEAGKQYEKLITLDEEKKTAPKAPVVAKAPEAVAKAPEASEKAKSAKLLTAGNRKDKKQTSSVKKSLAVKKAPSVKLSRKDLMNSAVVSYYNALKKRDEMNYYQTEFARSGLRHNGNLYVKENPSSPKVPDILFNVAWITFDEGKYNEAITIFTDFIKKYPKGEAAESAIKLTMDTYHLKEDYEGLVNFGRTIVADKRVAPKLRNEIASVIKASEAKIVSTLTIDAMNDWELGKQNIEKMVEENKSTGLGEQALNALIISSKDKGKLDTIFSAGYKLIKYYPKSPHVADVLAIMIDSAGNASQLRVVAKYLEEFSRRLPKHEKTGEFLKQAGQIRRALGQYELSTRDYEQYLRLTRKGTPGRVDAMFAIAENCKETGNMERAVKTLDRGLREMPGVEAIRARAFIAEYYRESGDFKKALKYRKVAIKQYKPKYGQKSPEMNDIYSAMVFNAVHGSYDQYMRTKLTGKIDNNIVARKAKLLENLENGYTSVISGQSPAWVLKACYYSYEVNREFAVFLKESPLPDGLTADQKTQYKGLIAQQAKAYDDKAAEYLKTCKNQAVKWEIIDPDVMRLIVDEDIDSGGFGGQSSVSEIAEQFLKDEELKNLHYEVFHQPENIDLLMKLAGMYYDRTDYYQAQLLAWKVVDHNDAGSSMKAKAYKLIGISNLYTGNDTKARDAFKKALELNPGDVEATINLAGILKHYKQTSAAEKLYSDLPEALDINAGTSIHPVAKEMYYAHVKS